MEKCRLLLISKQIMLREALAGLLDKLPGFRVVGATACTEEALSLAKQHQADLLLTDCALALPVLQTLRQQVEKTLPGVSLLLFSDLAGRQRLLELLPLQARGYLTTDLSPEAFCRLMNDAVQGQPAISPTILEDVLKELRGISAKGGRVGEALSCERALTSREKEVLRHLISGATNREIAGTLVISECTVKNHIHNMLEKLKIHNRTQLISYAMNHGLHSPFGL